MTTSEEKLPKVLLLGNPNVGKTSLWNHLTGGRARVGNYPGVTVERRSGPSISFGEGEKRLELIDVPGTYSLSARSPEEQIAMGSVLGSFGEQPDAIVIVVDAGQLSRCLYLTISLLELGLPTIIAMNMADEAGSAAPDPEALAAELGVPVVVTNGRSGTGGKKLLEVVAGILTGERTYSKVHVKYPKWVTEKVDSVAECLPKELRRNVERDRAVGLWALSSIEKDDELVGIADAVRARVLEVLDRPDDFDRDVAIARYQAIDAILSRLALEGVGAPRKFTEKVDRFLLHPTLGLLAFTLVMVVVFQALFSWSDPLIGVIEFFVTSLEELLLAKLPPSVLTSLLAEGVVGGVGNVIVFLPQILLLFLFIGFLEDSGYMARVAYLMDRVMQSLGLHGRAFVPMMSGFACAVPAILSTRTLERKRDRLLTMMVIPLTTCSARLPVYSVVIGSLLPAKNVGFLPVQGLLLAGMYLLSLVMSMFAAWAIGRLVIKGKNVPLILELPPYRLPRFIPTLKMMQEKAMQFLREAGTIILVTTVVLWALLHFPHVEECSPSELAPQVTLANPGAKVVIPPCEDDSARALEKSYGGRLGRAIEPVLAPLGFDWKIGTGIIGAFAAREVFVSTLALVYGVEDGTDEALPLRDKIRRERLPSGEPRYRALTGLSLLVFFAFACQCMSTLAVVRRETDGFKWPLFLFGYMSVLAYGASFLVFQVGSLLGF